MRSWRWAAASALLVAVTTLMPLTRSHPVPGVVGVLVALGLAAAVAAGAWLGQARTLLALAVVGWTGLLLVLGRGSVDVVLVSGIALRLWAGLPELVLLGRGRLRDLLPELVGGGCAAALVLYAAQGADGQDPSALLLAAAAGVLLVALGSLRLRR
jgi:hypothetical protein